MEGTPKAIEMKGIVRNATKIGVQDGQAEDLINLRFMDGTWRASGDGRLVHTMSGTIYEQLYVHTNIYHHLLGVDNGTLYWFAEIDNDGVTFYPLDGTTDRSLWPEDKQGLPTERKALTNVVGDIWITQNGHLLTVIDESEDFEHFVFKTGEDKYISVDLDVNGKSKNREIFPFGQVHFNWYSQRPDVLFKTKILESPVFDDDLFTQKEFDTNNHEYLSFKEWVYPFDFDTFKNHIKTIQGELRSHNKFSGALLVCAAIRLYDGSYMYASNPVLIYPRQQAFDKKSWFEKQGEDSYIIRPFSAAPDYNNYENQYFPYQGHTIEEDGLIKSIRYDRREDGQGNIILVPKLLQFSYLTKQRVGIEDTEFYDDILPPLVIMWQRTGDSGSVLDRRYISMLGYDLTFSIDNIDTLFKNKDIFTHLCIFVTPDIDTINISNDKISDYGRMLLPRDTEDVLYDLLHSPLFLLKEYKVEELGGFQANAIVDLSHIDDNGLLEHDNIVQKKQLPTEALSRTTYLPKVSYMYNGRLHIANYKSYPFFGYPIDLFHLHNHSVKVQDGAWFKDVLPNLADNNDAYLQYQKERVYITNEPDLISAGAPYLLIKTYLSTSQGKQIVCRYIQAYDPSLAPEHTANFIEALNPLLTYPDTRAKKMEIYYIEYYNGSNEDTQFGDYIVRKPGLHIRKKEFLLKPHPYLNMAYYIDPALKPIQFSNFEPLVEPTIQ